MSPGEIQSRYRVSAYDAWRLARRLQPRCTTADCVWRWQGGRSRPCPGHALEQSARDAAVQRFGAMMEEPVLAP